MLSVLDNRRLGHLILRVSLPILLALVGLGLLSWNIGVLRAAPVSGTITGTAFKDGNTNGAREAAEAGVAGVTVSAYDAAGVLQGVATTTVTGAYTLTATGTGPYRIEFTNWPANLYPGVFGASSATTVQFVSDGNSANINVSFNDPAQSCAATARLATSEFVVGDNSIQMAPSMVAYLYSTNATFGTYAQDTLSRCDFSGSLFGLAYQRSTDTLFGASYVRRRAGLGPSNSTGTIYRITNAYTVTTHTTSIFIDLNAVAGITTGVNPHPNGSSSFGITDTQAFTVTSKIGLGDLDISDNEQTLYVMNLNQRELIVLPLGPGPSPITASILTRPVPTPASCNGDGITAPHPNDRRPFALKYYEGSLYIGMVCTSQSMMVSTYFTATTITQTAPARDAMRGYVYRFDPGTNTFDATPLLEFPLNYPRLQVNDGFTTTGTINDGEWLPWTDVWRPAYEPIRPPGTPTLHANPQPLLSDIEFDGLGYMMLGFRDRFSDQSYSTGDPGPSGSGPNLNGRFGGEVLLACQTGGGSWVLESAGTCNTRTTGTVRANSGPGPVGGPFVEFYHSERFNPFHEETAMGGLASLYGSGELVSSAYDVFATFEAGTMVFSNTTGNKMRAAQLYPSGSGFGKGGGVGDVELMCPPAPVEIGNRVWLDPPHDGVQGPTPGEPGIAGVTVHLYTITGTLISTATTSANGEYYFSSGPGVSTANARYNLPLQFGASYSVRLDNAADYAGVGALTGLFLTETDDSLPSPSGSDINDNDSISTTNPVGSPAGVWPVIDLTVGGTGQNNHTYDFGFSPIPAAVELLYFNIQNVNGVEITLGWATASEIDNFGFTLYRAPVHDFAQAANIHFESSAIPGGTGGGATYTYVDTAPQPGEWWYWLVDVDTQGHAITHGPVSTVAPWAVSPVIYLPVISH